MSSIVVQENAKSIRISVPGLELLAIQINPVATVYSQVGKAVASIAQSVFTMQAGMVTAKLIIQIGTKFLGFRIKQS